MRRLTGKEIAELLNALMKKRSPLVARHLEPSEEQSQP